MATSSLFALYILLDVFLLVRCGEWGYSGEHGPKNWDHDCNEDHQSPVDIITSNVLPDPELSMLKFEGYDQKLSGGVFINNGHTVQLNFQSNTTFTLSGGGMNRNTYTALQLHFHWAPPGSVDGSEHTVDGMQYPVEMHIVHIKDPFDSLGKVKDKADGLTVLGVFLQVDKDGVENKFFQKLFDTANMCTHSGDEQVLTDGPPLIALLPTSGSFYRYPGSLTTPPCYEAVTWTVFQEPVYISQSQLEILQGLQRTTRADDDGDCSEPNCHGKDKRSVENSHDDDDEATSLGGNFRPTQPLNGRVVTSYLDIGSEADGDHHWSYHGRKSDTSDWSRDYPVCDGNTQSPIGIDSFQAKSSDAEESSESAKPMQFRGYDQPVAGNFVNNGHSVQLNFKKDLEYALSEGGLEESYLALQLHFHWGEATSEGKIHPGSEHTLDGKRYPAEMHIVHFKESYAPSLSEFQANSSDAFTVLGVFVDVFDSGESDEPNSDDGHNEDMQALMDAVVKVQYKDDDSDIPTGPSLASFLPVAKSFYRYQGSLTTPPCSESVIWTVFDEPITISLNQFIAFQRLFLVEETQVRQRNTIGRIDTVALSREMLSSDLKDTASGPERVTPDTSSLLGKILTSRDAKQLSAIMNEKSNMTYYLLRNNYRPLQPLNERSVYYYQDPNGTTVSGMTPTTESPVLAIVLWTLAGIAVFVIMTVIAMRCFCRKKKTRYTAGTKSKEPGVTL